MFKAKKYNSHELLYIYSSNNNYAYLNNCHVYYDDVTCKISREEIEEILVKNNEAFQLGEMNDNIGLVTFKHVLDITFYYKYIEKEDIFLEINQLVGGTSEIDVPVGFLTNVTDIPNLMTEKFEDNKYFRKFDGRPLMLLQTFTSEVNYDWDVNENKETILNDIHYKYNFRIQKKKYKGKIEIKNRGTKVLLVYPHDLNYTSDEYYPLTYIMDAPKLAEGIKL